MGMLFFNYKWFGLISGLISVWYQHHRGGRVGASRWDGTFSPLHPEPHTGLGLWARGADPKAEEQFAREGQRTCPGALGQTRCSAHRHQPASCCSKRGQSPNHHTSHTHRSATCGLRDKPLSVLLLSVTIRFILQINITNKIYKQSISRSSGLPTHTQPVCPYILTFLFIPTFIFLTSADCYDFNSQLRP